MTDQTGYDESGYHEFRAARDLLLELREDWAGARARYAWPRPAHFNWALDWFDRVAADPARADTAALRVLRDDGDEDTLTWADLSTRSHQVAGWLRAEGVDRGDRLLLMLGNTVELWEVLLAAMKLGVVVIPASTLLTPVDLRDRVQRGHVRHVVARSADTPSFADVPGSWTRIAVGEPVRGWLDYALSGTFLEGFAPEVETRSDETLLLYFTSGTTAHPKLVEHSHLSYPVGHLSTMYWIGVRPGDVHLNISSPGWAKHAWSNVFAPWNAEATVLVVDQARFAAGPMLEAVARAGVTTFCAPPTVWRLLVQADLAGYRGRLALREVVGAGEPLNPEVIAQVRTAWGLTIRDGYGQTETTLQIGNSPGQPLRPGSMGRPMPGYDVVLVDPQTGEEADEGEICLRLDGPYGRPVGLMTGYASGRGGGSGDVDAWAGERLTERLYRTGDVASRDADGVLTYVGRADDVFKAADYRISPFELESVLIEHPAVAEAAVVPSPDPVRLAVPKAYVVLAAGYEPTAETAASILRYGREHLAPYLRVRRLEFAELPKTISGKIRRVELRARELERHGSPAAGSAGRAEAEFWEEDLD